MQTRGHAGAALLAFAPVAFALAVMDAPSLAAYGCLGVVSLSMLPDLDCWLPIAHRGPTHTVWFLGIVVGVLAAASWTGLGVPGVAGLAGAAFGACVGLAAVGSHLLADVITPMGIRPFAPLSRRSYSLGMTLSRDERWNAAFLGVGLASAVAAPLLGTLVGSVVA